MGSTDSKLRFKRKIFKLADPNIISQNDKYWDMFWKEPQYADDIFNLVTYNDIKAIKLKNPVNFYLLIRIVSLRLVHLANHPKFPCPSASKQEVLNCCRLLTRTLPFLFEDADSKAQENAIFWKKSTSGGNNNSNGAYSSNTNDATVGSFTPASSISNIDSSAASLKVNIHNPDKVSTANTQKSNVDESGFDLPLGAKLVHACASLLFVKGFTVPINDNNDPKSSGKNVRGIEYSIWEPGIGLNGKFQQSNPLIDANRLEVMRLLVTLCSKSLYNTPQTIIDKGSRFLTVLVTSLPQMKLLSFLCVLVNVTCRGCITNECLSNSSNMVSIMQTKPVLKELRCLLLTYCVQLLALTLSYPIPTDDINFLKELNILGPSTNNATRFPPNNLIRLYLSKLHKSTEIMYLIINFVKYLKIPMLELKQHETSRMSMIKNKSPETIDIPLWITEIVMILWELFQCNKNFSRGVVLAKNKVTGEYYSNELITILLYYVVTYSQLEEFKNTKRLISYFILYLTANQLVTNNLLVPIKAKFFSQLPSHFTKSSNPVTYRDLFVYQTCQMLIFNSTFSFDILTPSYFEWLYNLIPIAKPVSEQTKPAEADLAINAKLINPGGGLSYSCCGAITQLIIKLSSPNVLMENSMNPDLLSLLVRSICNAVIFNTTQSRNLLYIVVKNSRIYHNVFETIIGLSNEDEQQQMLQNLKNMDQSQNQIRSRRNSEDKAFVIDDKDTKDENEENDKKGNEIEKRKQNLDDHENPNNNRNKIGQDNTHGNRQVLNAGRHRDLSKEDRELNQALRPAPPAGMSEKAKGKLPINAPLSKTWSGLVAINIILKSIELIIAEIPDFETYKSNQMLEVLDKITGIPDLSKKINEIDQVYHHRCIKLQPLRFVWSKVSLGWYESILWGKVFNIEIIIRMKFVDKNISNTLTDTLTSFGLNFLNGNEAKTIDAVDSTKKNRSRPDVPSTGRRSSGTTSTSSTGFFSKISNGWGLSNNNNDNNSNVQEPISSENHEINEQEYSKRTIISMSFYTGTAIKLFKVKATAGAGPTLSKPKGAVDAVANNFMKQLSFLTGAEAENDNENGAITGEEHRDNMTATNQSARNSISTGRPSIQISDIRSTIFSSHEYEQ